MSVQGLDRSKKGAPAGMVRGSNLSDPKHGDLLGQAELRGR